MGEHEVRKQQSGESHRQFIRHVLNDLHALRKMLDMDAFERGVTRIGAEQEVFLVDQGGRPAPSALQVLEEIEDPRVTTELALFQIEVNLSPLKLEGDCLSRMHGELTEVLRGVREASRRRGADVVLAGILPSLRKSDMSIANMTPSPRYDALNKAVSSLRGRPFEFHIKGVDELRLSHESVMLEACNSSFQVHIQVEPAEFTRMYNASQMYAAPVLAAAVNSPMLFGKRLWQETRIALFAQATDTRHSERSDREMVARVHFGRKWLDGSVVDIYKEDISRFRSLVGTELDEDPFEVLDRGALPELKALRLHNGTVWRWNRPCYGITDGRPHLRIENRILPSGPTVMDEMANAAFWLGLMAATGARETDFSKEIEFELVKENFVAAARLGLSAQFSWLGGRTVPADRLVKDELLPLAREGLLSAKVDAAEVDRYLDVVSERVSSGRTGARWALQSFVAMKGKERTGTASERLSALTRALVARQMTGEPAHRWNLAELDEAGGWKRHYTRVEQYMVTDLFTVNEEDSVDLVANMMDWHHIRHVPVEDSQHRLVGVVSYRALLRLLAEGKRERADGSLAISEVMRKDPIVVSPDTSTLDAIELMGRNAVSCLPVVRDGRLVGIVSERDFMVITRELLLQKLKE